MEVGVVRVVVPLVKYYVWTAVNLLFIALQRVVWLCNGTSRGVVDSRQPENYQRSAQVLKVVARHRGYHPHISTMDFLTIHEQFDSPERVLQDHVSLYTVTSDEAIFVEALPGSELWRGRYSAFFHYAQFCYAVRIVRMPVASFNRLAAQVGDPHNVTFLMFVVRSGSTLLTRMFEETGKVVAFSEPGAPDVVLKLGDPKQPSKDPIMRNLVVSTFRLLCKPTTVQESGYIVKLLPWVSPYIPILKSLFPRANLLFIYRDGLKATQSTYRAAVAECREARWLILKSQIKAYLLTLAKKIGLVDNTKGGLLLKDALSVCASNWALSHHSYRQLYESGLPIVAVRYEDLVADPETNMRRILRHCGLPELSAVDAVRAMHVDSQLNSPLSISRLQRHRAPEYAGAVREEIEKMCDFFKLPRFTDEPYIAPGTITTGVN